MRDEIETLEVPFKLQPLLDEINSRLPIERNKVLYAVTPSRVDPIGELVDRSKRVMTHKMTIVDTVTNEPVEYSVYETMERNLGLYPNKEFIMESIETNPIIIPHRTPRTIRDIMFNKKQVRHERRNHKRSKFGK